MLGGHERDRRRARLGLRLSGASLTIRMASPASPGMGGLGYLTLAPWPAAAEHHAARHAHHRCSGCRGRCHRRDRHRHRRVVVGRIRAISHGPRQRPELHRSASVTIINRRREHRPPNTPARGTRPSMPYVGEPGTGNVLSGHALKLKGKAVLSHLDDDLAFCASFFEVSHGLSG